jgi:hypothetical protein
VNYYRPSVFLRPAVRRRGDFEAFAESKLLFPMAAEANANGEAKRLRRQWSQRTSAELETVLLLETEVV